MPLTDMDSTAAHVRHGIKTGGAAVLSLIIASLLDPKFGMWAVVSSVIVMQVNVAESVQMCWYRFTGTALGAAIGILAIVLSPHTFWGTSAALFLSIGFCAYMTRYNPRYRMAAITVAIVLIASLGVPDRIMFSLMRVVEIGIGVLCAYVVSVWVFPTRVGESLKVRLQRHCAQAANLYEQLVESFLGNQAVTAVQETAVITLLQDATDNRGLFRKMLRHEVPLFDDNAALMDRQIVMLGQCARHMQAMFHVVQDTRDGGYNLYMAPEIRAVVTASCEIMRAIGRGETPDLSQLQPLLDKSDRKLEELRSSGVTKRFSVRELVQVLAFYRCVQQVGEDLQTALGKKNASPHS